MGDSYVWIRNLGRVAIVEDDEGSVVIPSDRLPIYSEEIPSLT